MALERAEITQLSNSSHVIIFTVPALERAEITQLSNYLHILIAHIFALERAEITQLSNLKPEMFDFRVSSVLDC